MEQTQDFVAKPSGELEPSTDRQLLRPTEQERSNSEEEEEPPLEIQAKLKTGNERVILSKHLPLVSRAD